MARGVIARDEMKEQIVNEYRDGKTVLEIAMKAGVSDRTIYKWLRERGVKLRGHLNDEDKNLIVSLYERGRPTVEIATIMGRSVAAINEVRRAAGVPSPRSLKSQKGTEIWEKEKKKTIVATVDENPKVDIRCCEDTVLDYIKCMDAKELAELFGINDRYWFTQGRLSAETERKFNVKYDFDNVEKPFWVFGEETLNMSLDLFMDLLAHTDRDIERMSEEINGGVK